MEVDMPPVLINLYTLYNSPVKSPQAYFGSVEFKQDGCLGLGMSKLVIWAVVWTLMIGLWVFPFTVFWIHDGGLALSIALSTNIIIYCLDLIPVLESSLWSHGHFYKVLGVWEQLGFYAPVLRHMRSCCAQGTLITPLGDRPLFGFFWLQTVVVRERNVAVLHYLLLVGIIHIAYRCFQQWPIFWSVGGCLYLRPVGGRHFSQWVAVDRSGHLACDGFRLNIQWKEREVASNLFSQWVAVHYWGQWLVVL